MTKIKTRYLGMLRTENIHLPSGTLLLTDAPVDNKGKGEKFSPTDLVATALCDCMLTIMGIVAQEHGFSIDAATADVEKIMTDKPPRRIARVIILVDLRACELSEKQKKMLAAVPPLCPVALSLHPDIVQDVRLIFD